MTFLLSVQNVFDYLIEHGFCSLEAKNLDNIEPKIAKNFNLLVNLPDGQKLLVKQEPYNKEGKTAGEFAREWSIQEFVQQFSAVNNLKIWLPEILSFDADNSILVVKYLEEYDNLAEFYSQENNFAPAIASSIGCIIASFHRQTFNHQDYQDFFSQNNNHQAKNATAKLDLGLDKIGPEIFGQVPADGLKFFTLCQRYDSLGKAIAQLDRAFTPSCLTHNDLKLNNLLIPSAWSEKIVSTEELTQPQIELKLIDWERCGWGDPACDLGMLIGSYLIYWLQSLVVSKSMSLEESLRLATIPLEKLQPSLSILTTTYADCFPEITTYRPDFWQTVMQFTGWSLIKTIQATLQYEKSFNNTGICMLQVAKTLLCNPTASISSVLGIEAKQLERSLNSLV